MTAEPTAPTAQRRIVDVALETRVRRWTADLRDGHTVFDDQPADDVTGDTTRVGYGQMARIAVFAGPDADHVRACLDSLQVPLVTPTPTPAA